ncbi:lysozyme inhibitor LprI family protein [Azospirillum soli]|uniref:lysozyme inhibitor LprI family protein n=1 Tax=Azospirillum soli TaxID=1304799 RepID=UPI001FE4A03C|nr:lysozyme inhibitor LprI family protein [Azospirillum soli]MBP2315768.1 uncharacterized protein [Azospirillum soli]
MTMRVLMPLAVMVLAVMMLACPSLSWAASFSCAKASTPTEKAICADAGLSKLDERLSAAYRDGIKLLSGASPEENEARSAVKADQRAWLGERNACGADTACLRTAYERRVAVLTFHPDPGAPSPADRFVGKFDYEDFMGITAMALRDGRVAVSVSGAEPTTAKWVCDFAGIGQLDKAGKLLVGAPDAEGNGLILEAKGASTVEIPDHPANRAASSNWCGMNGTFMRAYRSTK